MNISDIFASSTGPSNTASATDGENQGTNTNTPSADVTTGEDFTTFLTLLTAQIKNQDPLAPLDSTQFVEQLATFSGLELQAKANNFLEDIANMLGQTAYTNPPTAPEPDTKTQSKLL